MSGIGNGYAKQSVDEFLEDQRNRSVRSIVLSIENEMKQGHKHLKDIAWASKLMAKSGVTIGIFIMIVVIIAMLKGTNLSMKLKDWVEIHSSVAEVN